VERQQRCEECAARTLHPDPGTGKRVLVCKWLQRYGKRLCDNELHVKGKTNAIRRYKSIFLAIFEFAENKCHVSATESNSGTVIYLSKLFHKSQVNCKAGNVHYLWTDMYKISVPCRLLKWTHFTFG